MRLTIQELRSIINEVSKKNAAGVDRRVTRHLVKALEFIQKALEVQENSGVHDGVNRPSLSDQIERAYDTVHQVWTSAGGEEDAVYS